MKALLLQVRDHAPAEAQEIACFEQALDCESLARCNLVSLPKLRWSDVRHADLLLLGGAGEHSVTRTYPYSPYLNDVLERWIDIGRPFFGSCYGHHVLAKLFGATIIADSRSEEVGTFDVSLTESGLEDPVFSDLPGRFPAHFGHHDRVADLPGQLLELARSERGANQALRVRGKLAYTTQFHPEMDQVQMCDRLMMYRDNFLAPETTFDTLLQSLRPTPEAGHLLRRFVEVCL